METTFIMKIILPNGSSQRLTLTGLPACIEDLKTEVKRQCRLQGHFSLQFKDSVFGGEFLNLTSISEVEDKGTLKVIDSPGPLMQPDAAACSLMQPQPHAASPVTIQSPSGSETSLSAVDTDILSSSDSISSRSSWPAVFQIPTFTYDAQLKLTQAAVAYLKDGTLFTPDPKLKSDILEGILQDIVRYKIYITGKQAGQVAQSLIKRHPCLAEKGSDTGYGGWKTSIKNKVSNYRTQLKKIGCPEVTVNALKNKPEGRQSPAFGVKKARRAEVNFCPAYPATETEESLDATRKALLLDSKRKNNREAVRVQMEKTFALRRREVVRDTPMVADFMARWPALFEVTEINAEFKRITTVPLQSKFLSQIDLHSDNLIKLFRKRGGQIGKSLQAIIEKMTDCDIDAGRECLLKGLCIYMGEDPENLVQEYVGMDEVDVSEAIEDTTVGIYVLSEHESSEPEDIGVVLEGIKVLTDLDNIPLAVTMLLGLMYALNLRYPPDLKYTLEALQKIFMELDEGKLSNKVAVLKNRLFQ